MVMTQEERAAASNMMRTALGVNRSGTSPDAGLFPPRPGSPLAFTASTKRPLDDEIYGIQMYGYGEIWGRPVLSLRERSFITLGVLTGLCRDDQIMIHVNNALNLGLTADEISELILHVGIYAGIPAWHNASNIARYVFVQRGILEAGPGVALVPLPPTSRQERRANAEQVKAALGAGKLGLDPSAGDLRPLAYGPAAIRAAEPLPFEDEITEVQEDYAYGEIWIRPTLDLRTRILIAVAVLQALGLNDQLHTNINIAMNLGVTAQELSETFLHVGVYAGLPGWRNAANVARDVFIQRGVQQPSS
jgi:4-carboxymuconolactone decarboxylase